MPIAFRTIFTTILICTSAAAAESLVRYDFGTRGTREFVFRDSGRLVISPDCERPDRRKPCDARQALARAAATRLHVEGGRNPGAVLCSTLKGRVEIGEDQDRNSTSFCAFPDGSALTCNSLYYGYRPAGPRKER